jgi:catechol 2,3-dioxygenase-like lactoylglutathione lyase family enzyme
VADLHYLSMFAELAVADVDASVAWYESALGFHAIATYRFEGGDAVHLRRSEGQDLLLRQRPDTERGSRATGSALNFATDGRLAAMASTARAAGADCAYVPLRGRDEPKVLEVRDPDGHALRFFAREVPGPRSPTPSLWR